MLCVYIIYIYGLLNCVGLISVSVRNRWNAVVLDDFWPFCKTPNESAKLDLVGGFNPSEKYESQLE